MFALPLIALALGFILVYLPGNFLPANEAFARYTAVAVLAGLDTVLGGLRAWLEDKFDDAIFISGFFVNSLLAVGLVILGERLGLETGLGDGRISVMMIGAVVVFSGRILNNLAALRRLIVERFRRDEAVETSPESGATARAN
ncbi:MAG TPA: small basic family protein [Abditibacterium sp.]|jgi:small basic protein